MARPFMFAALCQRTHPLKHSLAESIFVSQVRKTAKKSSLAEKFVSRVTRQPRYRCTQFWLHVSVLPNHPQANIYYMELHSVCTYIMGSHYVYIKSYQFRILILSIKSIDRIYFKNMSKYSYQCEGIFILKLHIDVLRLNKPLY